MSFDIPGHKLLEYLANMYPNVTEDVRDEVKGQIFDSPSSPVSPGKVAVLDGNKAEETAWIVSEIFQVLF